MAIDGFTAKTIKDGMSVQIIEAIGDGSTVALPSRYNINPAECRDECLLIFSNYPPEDVFSLAEWNNVCKVRFAVIQCTEKYDFRKACDIMRRINNLPPLSQDSSVLAPININVRYDSGDDDE